MAKQGAHQDRAVLTVRVTPRARQNAIIGIQANGTIQVRLSAPPVDGQANEALLAFLAEVLDVPKTRLALVAGHASREKRVMVSAMDAETAHTKIAALVQKPRS